MIFTSKMVHLTAIVLRDHSSEVTKELLGIGAVQFSRLADLSPSAGARLRETTVGETRNALEETRRRIETLLALGGLQPPRVTATDMSSEAAETQEINSRLDRLVRDIEQYRKRQSDLQQEINPNIRCAKAALVRRRFGGGRRRAATRRLGQSQVC